MSNVVRLCTESDLIPLVPANNYTVCYIYHETGNVFRTPKLTIWFKIMDFGEHFEKIIPRYYNVRNLIGKPGKGGRFVVGRSQDFLREYCQLFPDRITRLDRISLTPFENKLFTVKARIVKKDYKQRDLAPQLHYSVVDRIVRVER